MNQSPNKTREEMILGKMPPEPKWKWTLADSDDIVFFCQVPPNRFHRFMQKIMLGIYWEELK